MFIDLVLCCQCILFTIDLNNALCIVILLQLDDNENEGSGFVFMSENALTTTDKLLILIHGSGVVRAGQWARRLIINDCLDSGTQIPYIQRAMKVKLSPPFCWLFCRCACNFLCSWPNSIELLKHKK